MLSITIVAPSKTPDLYSFSSKYVEFGWGGRIRTAGMHESKSCALPLGYTPKYLLIILMGWKMGLEPTASSATN